MNIALLVLRLVPGVLFIGHGLQKLVPTRFSLPLLAAHGPRATAAGFAQMGLAPALPLALLAALGEVGGGFLLAAGLVTPLATALLAAVMTVAILVVHLRRGIWGANGGFEFPLLMLTAAYVVSALGGPGDYSLDNAFAIGNWAGIGWSASEAVKAGAAVGAGAVAALLTLAFARAWARIGHSHHQAAPTPAA